MGRSQFKALFIFVVCATLFALPANAEQSLTPKQYVREVARETLSIWKRNLVEPLSHVWEPWFVPKSINLSTLKSSQENTESKHDNQEKIVGEVLAFSGSVATNELTKEEVLTWLKDLFLLQQTTKYSQQAETQAATPVITRYYSSGVTQGLADSLSRSVREIDSSIGGDLDALEANGVFNTSVLSVDTVNTRVGIGTSTPTDTLSINGATYIAQISAPSNTSNRLYNTGGSLYWAGNLIGGASTGNWVTDGTSVWRESGNVGVGTTSPTARLHIYPNANSTKGLIVQGDNNASSNLQEWQNSAGTLLSTFSNSSGYGTFNFYNNGGTYISSIGVTSGNSLTFSTPYNGNFNFTSGQSGQSSTVKLVTAEGKQAGIQHFDVASANGRLLSIFGQPGVAISFSPAETEAMRITTGGNVGIGTTSPFTNFSVAGSGFFDGGTVTASTFTATSSILVGTGAGTEGGDNNLIKPAASSAFLNIKGGSGKAKIIIGNEYTALFSGNSGEIRFNTNSTGSTNLGLEIARLDEGLALGSGYVSTAAPTNGAIIQGNVGVGTTTPFAKLSVESTAGAAQFVVGSSTATQFIVDRNGNVGIGTANPTPKLDVVTGIGTGATNEANSFRLRHSSTDGNTMSLIMGVNNSGGGSGGGSNAQGYAYLQSNYWGGGVNTISLNPNGGGVSIGSNNAGQALDIRGSIISKVSGTNSQLGKMGFNGAGNYSAMPAFIGGYADNGVWTSGIGLTFNTISGADVSGTDGTERMRITSGGNVGIGTTSPQTTLHITGGGGNPNTSGTTHTGNLRLKSSTNSLGNVLDFGNQTASPYGSWIQSTDMNNLSNNYPLLLNPNGGNVGIGTTTPWGKLSITNTGTGHSFIIEDSSSPDSTPFVVDTNGNVGIGTPNPAQKLEISEGVLRLQGYYGDPAYYTDIYQTYAANGPFKIDFKTASQSAINVFTAQYGSTTISNAGFVSFRTGVSNTERMRIDSNGNVGIGTTSPAEELSIGGSSPFISTDTSDGFDNKYIGLTGGGADGDGTRGAKLVLSGNERTTYTGTAELNMGDVSGSYISFGKELATSYMRIINGGNVGIGTTTPWRKLSVNGTVAMPGLVNDSTGYYVCLNTTTGQMSTSTTACGASSERFKENITDISYGLEEVLSLRPVSFDYKQDYIPNAPKQLGFIAEEVDLLVPELVARDDAGEIQGLDYPKFTAILAKAIQQLSKKIDDVISQMQVALAWFTSEGKLKVQNDICVDDVCVTKDQFKQLLLDSAVGATQYTDNSTQTVDDSGEEEIEKNASTTPETIEEGETEEPETTSSTPEIQNEEGESASATPPITE